MGKIDAESSVNHFSHPHPLKLLSLHPSTSNRITCSGCKNEASGLVYTCESCNYCLHKPCSNMPQFLNHISHKNHTLTLLPKPAYEEGSFHCNACGVLGAGFCYHCADCQLDLHTVCAFVRSTVKRVAHDHPLTLCFEPPYENKSFICDVCGGSGSDHWLYRCDSCGFDSHLKCAKKVPTVSVSRQQPRMDRKPECESRTAMIMGTQPQMIKSKSAHCPVSQMDQYVFPHVAMFHQPQVGMPMISGPYPLGLPRQLHRYHTAPVSSTVQQPTRNDTVQNVLNSMIEGLVEGGASQIGQAFIQGALGIN